MPSANGYKLCIDGYELVSVWPAPYYVLVLDDSDDPVEPMLIHCDDLDHAKRQAMHGGIILDGEFARYSNDPSTNYGAW